MPDTSPREGGYFLLWYRLDRADRYLIWFAAEGDGGRDGVVLDSEQRVLSFGDQESARSFATRNDLPITDERPILHDLDRVASWLSRPRSITVPCVPVLAAWNLFIDVQASVEDRDVLRGYPEQDDIYGKIFWGNNLPSMTPPGKQYVPLWSRKEIYRLRTILKGGLRVFRKAVRFAEQA